MEESDGLLFERYRTRDLSTKKLKVDERTCIANLVIDEIWTAANIALRYHLNVRTVRYCIGLNRSLKVMYYGKLLLVLEDQCIYSSPKKWAPPDHM